MLEEEEAQETEINAVRRERRGNSVEYSLSGAFPSHLSFNQTLQQSGISHLIYVPPLSQTQPKGPRENLR
jgi:hypothetical protein